MPSLSKHRALKPHKMLTRSTKQHVAATLFAPKQKATYHGGKGVTLDMLPAPSIPRSVVRFNNADGSDGKAEVLLGANVVFD